MCRMYNRSSRPWVWKNWKVPQSIKVWSNKIRRGKKASAFWWHGRTCQNQNGWDKRDSHKKIIRNQTQNWSFHGQIQISRNKNDRYKSKSWSAYDAAH